MKQLMIKKSGHIKLDGSFIPWVWIMMYTFSMYHVHLGYVSCIPWVRIMYTCITWVRIMYTLGTYHVHHGHGYCIPWVYITLDFILVSFYHIFLFQ